MLHVFQEIWGEFMLPAQRAPQSFVIHTTPVITAVQVPPTLLLQSGLLLSSGLQSSSVFM